MALAGIKDGRQSRYKTTCLLIILILFSVFRQFDKLKFVGEIEYLFNTQFLFVFTQMMTATIIVGIILIIPIYAGPRIAILEYSGFTRYAKMVNALIAPCIRDGNQMVSVFSYT